MNIKVTNSIHMQAKNIYNFNLGIQDLGNIGEQEAMRIKLDSSRQTIESKQTQIQNNL